MRTWARLAAAGVIGWITCPSWADTTLDSFLATATADEVVPDEGPIPDLTRLDRDQRRKDTLDSPQLTTFDDTATKSTALAEIEVTAQVQGHAVTVDFMSRAEGVGTGSANGVGSTLGTVGLTVQFTTTIDRLPWTLEGIAQRNGPESGSGAARTVVRLRRAISASDLLRLDRTEDTAGDEVLTESGVLPAGTYTLTLTALAYPIDVQGATETVLDVTFRVEGTPVPEDPIEWKSPRSGSFGDAARWDPEQVPTTAGGRSDLAKFSLGTRPYLVTMGMQSVAGLAIDGGFPEFVEGRLVVSGFSEEFAACQVTQDAVLTVGPRMELNVRDAVVAEDTGGFTGARIRVRGDEARLTVVEDLLIGAEDDPGEVLLEQGTVGCGRTFLGNLGTAENDLRMSRLRVTGTESIFRTGDFTMRGRYDFRIDGGGEVQSGSVLLGATDSSPFCDVIGHAAASEETQSQWQVQDLATEPGEDALRFIRVSAGGRLEVLGSLTLANAYTSVQRPPSQVPARDRRNTTLRVGARFAIEETAVLDVFPLGAADLEGDVVLTAGYFNAAGGAIDLTGFTALPVEDVRVGTVPDTAQNSTTQARVHVTAGGKIETTTVGRAWKFGADPESRGELHVEGSGSGGPSRFVSKGDLVFGSSDVPSVAVLSLRGGCQLETTGQIRILASARVSGEPAPGGSSNRAKPARGLRAAPRSEAPEVVCDGFVLEGALTAQALRIDGDLTVAPGATVVAEIDGPPSASRPLPLTVTGTAALDGKLVLQFHGGYAPTAGEAVAFLGTQGAAPTGAFADVEVRGLAPGAQFEVAADGAGGVTATAVADTTALPSVSVKAQGKKLAERKTKKPARFTFTRTGPTTQALDVSYSLGGTAQAGEDFAAPAGTVTIPAGKKSATLQLPLTNDAVPETPEEIVLRVEASAAHTRGRTPRATLTLVDDDQPKSRR